MYFMVVTTKKGVNFAVYRHFHHTLLYLTKEKTTTMKKLLRLMMAVAVVLAFNVEAMAQIRINEVGTNGVDFEGASKWVELYNAGSADVDVTDLILCDFPQYPTVGSLAVLGGGSTTIPAGGFLVVAWPNLDMNGSGDAEVGLYVAGTFDFADAGAVLDYMQYGSAGHTREPAGVGAGFWSTGEFVPAAEAGMSLQFVDNGAPGSGNWVVAEPTPNAETAAQLSAIRISEIGFKDVDYEGAAKWVELQNTSDAAVDVTDLILCDFPQYPTVGSLTVLGGGNLVIPAGGFLVVAWASMDMDDDGDAEVGLYKAGSGGAFNQSSNVLDYMQYGEAGHQREGTAEGAGVWTAGDFVGSPEDGESLQLVDNALTGVANWVARPATPNAANGLATSVEDTEVPANFVLHANFPNPFNPTTTISYDLSRAGQVALDVYDMLGQKVTSLFDGGQAVGSYSYAWDGKDARGNVVSSGVYFYRLTLDGQLSQSRVMTLLK